MPVFDSSSLIYAWDNYPIENLPKIWQWLSQEISARRILLPIVTEREIERNSVECFEWLGQQSFSWVPATPSILQDALRIKNLLGIVEDKYGGGVGETDLIIIATARALGEVLVTNEAVQMKPPKSDANRRMPSVCSLPSVGVHSVSFLEFFRESREVFQ